MLTVVLLSLWLQSIQNETPLPRGRGSEQTHIARNAAARCADVFESPDERVKPSIRITPGAPPLLSFRYFEGKMRQRFSGIDLMLDDAGH
jgi:hypothetical protein